MTDYPQVHPAPFVIGALITTIGLGIAFGIGVGIAAFGVFVMLLSFDAPEDDEPEDNHK